MTARLPIDGQAGETLTLARHYSGLTLDDVPADVVAEARRLLLDTLACVIASAGTAPAAMVDALARALGAGMLPDGQDCLGRAYQIGRLANLMDLDESYPAGCHFGGGAVAGALTMAHRQRLDGRRLLAALVAGYELGGQVAVGIGPYFKMTDGKVERFLDVWGIATPVVFAAAGAAAHALGLSPELTVQAYAGAGSNAPIPIGGKWTTEVDLPNTKYCDTGWGAMTGVFGALSAAAGSTAVPSLLDGERGLIRIVGGADPDSARFLAHLGSRWHLRRILYKRWPCCRWNQYPLNALDALIEAEGLRPDEIAEIVVEVGAGATSRRFANPQPVNFASLQFSIPHAAAMLVLGVRPGPDWLSAERSGSAEVRAMRDRVRVEEHAVPWSYTDPFSDSEQPRQMLGAVRVTARGRVWREERGWAWGDSYHPEGRCDDADIEAKVRSLVAPAHAQRLIDLVRGIEDLADVGELVAALLAAMDAAR